MTSQNATNKRSRNWKIVQHIYKRDFPRLTLGDLYELEDKVDEEIVRRLALLPKDRSD